MTYWREIPAPAAALPRGQGAGGSGPDRRAQETAKRRRAELAAAQEHAAQTASAASQTTLAVSRRRVTEAEAAYALAIQLWDDKQFRR